MQPKYILVAEDEQIVGLDLCDTVREAGFEVEGPMPDISSAMLAYQKRKPDIAILDVQLDDGLVFAFAETLLAEDIPVIFHSGCVSNADIASRFPHSPALEKPCPPARMLASLEQALATARPA